MPGATPRRTRKTDYIVSKTAIVVFGGAAMIVAYVIGAVAAGLITGASFAVGVVAFGAISRFVLGHRVLA